MQLEMKSCVVIDEVLTLLSFGEAACPCPPYMCLSISLEFVESQ